MTDMTRKFAEKMQEENYKLKATILRLKRTNAEQAAEILRLEGEVRSLLLVKKSDCWGEG